MDKTEISTVISSELPRLTRDKVQNLTEKLFASLNTPKDEFNGKEWHRAVYLTPVAASRIEYSITNGKLTGHYKEAYANYREAVDNYVEQVPGFFDGLWDVMTSKYGVTADIEFHFKQPISSKKLAKTGAPDLDNLIKAALDTIVDERIKVGADGTEVTEEQWDDWLDRLEPLENTYKKFKREIASLKQHKEVIPDQLLFDFETARNAYYEVKHEFHALRDSAIVHIGDTSKFYDPEGEEYTNIRLRSIEI